MMNLLDQTLARAKKEKRQALIAYLAAGYPSFSEQAKLIQILKQEGVDVLELGIPFSDPISSQPSRSQAIPNPRQSRPCSSINAEIAPR